MISSRINLLTKLQKLLANPDTKKQIMENDAQRMFDDLPKDFWSDYSNDVEWIGERLKKIKGKYAGTDGKTGLAFTRKSDEASLDAWCKNLIARMCRELLTETNDIRPEILELLKDVKDPQDSHNIVCAYFSSAIGYFANVIPDSKHAANIPEIVFMTFPLYTNLHYSKWVREVLNDRLLDPNITYKIPAAEPDSDDEDDSIDPVVVAATIAGFALLGVFGGAAAYAISKSRNKHSNQPKDESQYDPDPPSFVML